MSQSREGSGDRTKDGSAKSMAAMRLRLAGGDPASKDEAVQRLNVVIETWEKARLSGTAVQAMEHLQLMVVAIEKEDVPFVKGWRLTLVLLDPMRDDSLLKDPYMLRAFSCAFDPWEQFETIERIKALVRDMVHRLSNDPDRLQQANMVLIALRGLVSNDPACIEIQTRRIWAIIAGDHRQLADTFYQNGRASATLTMHDGLRAYCEQHRTQPPAAAQAEVRRRRGASGGAWGRASAS